MPQWSDNIIVVPAQTMARTANPVRGTLDLRGKYGAYLYLKIGRGGTTAITNGVDLLVRRVVNNGTQGTVAAVHPGGVSLLSSTTAASATTCATSDSPAGGYVLNVASVTGFASEDIICIQDSGGGVTRLEWARVSKTATGVITVDSPLLFSHTAAGADTVRNKADVFDPIWLDGGSLWEVIFDQGNASGGTSEAITLMAQAQTWDS